MRVPRERPDTLTVCLLVRPLQLERVGIVYVEAPCERPDCQCCPLLCCVSEPDMTKRSDEVTHLLDPRHRADRVIVLREITQL